MRLQEQKPAHRKLGTPDHLSSLIDVHRKDVYDFEISVKEYIKPQRYKHFSRGNKLSNILLTRIRVGRSELNQHKFTISLVDSPEC